MNLSDALLSILLFHLINGDRIGNQVFASILHSIQILHCHGNTTTVTLIEFGSY